MTMTPDHAAALLPFRVGTRPVNRFAWHDESDNSIARARRAYDDGLVELCQGRTADGWVHLFAIPRKHPLPGRPPHAQLGRVLSEHGVSGLRVTGPRRASA